MKSNVWNEVRRHVQAVVGENNYLTWIQPLTLDSYEDGIVRLNAPTSFVAAWVTRNYLDAIQRGFRATGHEASRIELIVSARPAAAAAVAQSPDVAPREAPESRQNALATGGEDPLQARLDPRQTFETFVVGKPNLVAHAAARRVAEGGPSGFNPLFLYSSVGLGKTHLMNAIAWELRARFPEKRVIYLSAERFMFSFVRALRDKTILDFKSLFRSVDVLLIDDVQFIAGKDSTQEEFFHTFNALIDQNRQIVLSADRAPGDIKDLEERIRSRLQSGLTVDLHPADYELRLGILHSKLEQNITAHGPVRIEDGVLEFMADRITSSVRALEGALNRLCAISSLVGREITLDMAQDSLADVLRTSERRITIEEVQRRVAEHYNVRLADLVGPRRLRTVARPRQVAMYLSKTLTSRSLPEIGRRFGGRDHTTILHGIRKVEELRDADPQLNEEIEMLRRQLQT
jgi:chromosomal replication initiator protein